MITTNPWQHEQIQNGVQQSDNGSASSLQADEMLVDDTTASA